MTFASEPLLQLAWTQSWQLAVLAAVVAVIVRLACRRRPQLAYLLWMLVIAKALAPPLWSSPTGAFSWATAQTLPAVLVAPPSRASQPIEPSEPRTPPAQTPAFQVPPAALAPPPQVQVASPPQPPDARLTLAAALLSLWAFGAAGSLVIVLARRIGLLRLVRRTSQAVDAASQRHFDALRRQIGPSRPVRLVFTSAPLGPAAFGWWRGTVIVPTSLVRDTTSAELAQILAHELVHLRRFDTLAGSLQLAVQIIWWFHPAVWWANRRARVERERACDEAVVAELGCRGADYARLLVQVLQWRHHLTPAILWPGMRAWDVTSARLQHVLDRSHAFRRRTPAWCLLILLVGFVVALPGKGLQLAAEPPDSAARDSDSPKPEPNDSQADEAVIAELKRLGIEVQSYMSGAPIQHYRTVTIPPAFRPTGQPLPLAKLPGLQGVRVGLQPPQGPQSSRGPQPTEAELRAQILAAKNLPPAVSLGISYTVANAGALDALESIANLERLSLVAYKVDSALGEIGTVSLPRTLRFERLANLRTLTWWGPFETDLTRLVALQKLEHLGLLGRMVEPALRPLAELKNLKSLSLTHNWNEECAVLDLTFLDGIPKLASLTVGGTYTLSDAAARRLGRHGQFRRLSVDISALSDAGLRDFAAAKQLEELYLAAARNAEKLTSAGLAALGALANLKTLRFDGQVLPHHTPLVVNDESLAGWHSLGKLQSLYIDPCRIGDAGLREIGQLKSLEKLQLTGRLHITDAGLAPLAALTKLQTLVLHKSTINGSGLSALAGLDGLQMLSLKDAPIDDRGLEEIANFDALVALDLSGTAITDRGLERLPDKLPQLERLNLARTQITDRGFEALLNHKNLRRLDATGTKLTAAFLARLLADNPELWVWIVDSMSPHSRLGDVSGKFEPIEVQ
jgi:beta-lactamase regulating signal transducer with metallopeptidase domain/Leucine-rich repeat (LRR) protein